ncbi:PREDICTED: uncharacterized protein LOC109349782 isoform X2 [Lupinus angustifolius]|uniref:uncharacterized protein LOC109349782 isoform X2 n=1 Tax=Lupinus angustifolius TaxID=3871 RepID=UPI00092EC4F7|nr:PREDICTED: uncharacterized protein LOC109349782 isoform X2 [Lupinus angustifolius]
MADSDERKSFQSEYESDGDGPSPLRWTARRTEASDDDDSFEGEVVKRKFRCGSRCDESESECNDEGEPEYSEGGVVVIGEELEEVSQEEKEEEVCETVRFVKGEENQVLSPDFGPKHGFFYMHDDRFQSNRRYGSRRGSMIPKNGWDWTGEQKWKHDKFEEITVQDKNAPKNHHQHQRENRSKGHRYEKKDQVGPLENFGNPNKTSRIVKGRGPVKYRSTVESNNLNPSSKHQRSAKLKGSTSTSSSHGVLSLAFAMDSLPFSKSVTSHHLSTVKQPVSLPIPNVLQQKKTPYSIQSSDNRFPLLQMYHVIDQSLITDTTQAASFGLDFQLGGILSLLPVMQPEGLPYGAVDDCAPSMALVGYAPQPQLGSGNCGMTRYSQMR